MITSPVPQSGASLSLVEAGVTAIVIAIACFWPRTGHVYFARIERIFQKIAGRPRVAVLVCGLAVPLLRLAILPVIPVPLPFIHDDFSFLLAAETFASGRLTNPTPPMWTHFESFHITMQPTYMSMYFPGQGILLAAGKIVFGHPWFGLLIAGALMCSAICWMLQAWLPLRWAFLGGMIAVLRLALFSYWMNTYTGAGFLAALGGAVVLGALPRFLRTIRPWYGTLLALGSILLAFSRPYEGMLLCLPVAVVLGTRRFYRRPLPARARLIGCAAIPLALVIAAGSWMAYYDYRAFGNALTLPYTIDRAQYGVAPYYVWQSNRPEPVYRHAVMREFYAHIEADPAQQSHSVPGYLRESFYKILRSVNFFAGFALMAPLLMLGRAVRDRRIRFLVACVLVLATGMAIEIFLFPHYLAPFTVVFYAIGLQCMRHLRVWRPGHQPVGLALVRGCVALCVVLAAIRICAGPFRIFVGEWPSLHVVEMWYSADHYGTERAAIEDRLDRMPGKQLAVVRYAPGHNSIDEWVYNSPDIDKSRVIWAREMDPASNAELIRYYRDRRIWLVQPDVSGNKLQPYPVPIKIQPSPGELAGIPDDLSGK
jgi:hypothetical protein